MSSPDPTDAASPARTLRQLLRGAWVVQALHAAAALGVADALAGGPRPLRVLADTLCVDGAALERLLRALATLDVVACDDAGRWTTTPMGALLRRDVPGSLHGYALLHGRKLWPAWGRLADTVRAGRPAAVRRGGAAAFAGMRPATDDGAVFGAAMAGATTDVADALARALPLDGARTVMDVGGGAGVLLAAVLAAWPALRGVLVDLPYVADAARAHLDAAGVGDRAEVVAADAFAGLAPGADVVVLKSVLHDWDDADATALLGRCRAALPAHGRVVVIERALPDAPAATAAQREVAASDLTMLIATGGRERTVAGWTALLAAAGCAVRRVGDVAGWAVIEAAC